MWFRCLLLVWALSAGVAKSEPVVFVLAADNKVVVTNTQGQQFSALPTQRLTRGHKVVVPKGQRFAAMVVNTGSRRVFNGPARLEVIADTIRVLKGPAVKVIPLADDDLDLIEQWMAVYSRPMKKPPSAPAEKVDAEENSLRFLRPEQDALLLTRDPEFIFEGELPREGNLMVFDARGKRFWVEPLESHYVTLPKAARFEWGQSFTWEVRRLTGGRVVSGNFRIASEETARALLQARVPDTPDVLPESRLFYAMRLHLAQAYKEAADEWTSLGITLDPKGQPQQLRPGRP